MIQGYKLVEILWSLIPDEEIDTENVKVYYDSKDDFLYLGDKRLADNEDKLIYIGEY